MTVDSRGAARSPSRPQPPLPALPELPPLEPVPALLGDVYGAGAADAEAALLLADQATSAALQDRAVARQGGGCLSLSALVLLLLVGLLLAGAHDRGAATQSDGAALEVVPFAVELRGGDPVINERLRA